MKQGSVNGAFNIEKKTPKCAFVRFTLFSTLLNVFVVDI